MKKFKFAALLVCFAAMGMLFTSCKKDEDLIIGKWKNVKVVADGETITYSGDKAPVYEFKADNTLTVTYPGYGSMSGTYNLKNDVLTITYKDEDEEDTGKMNVDKLTKSKMILSDVDNKNNTAEFDKI